jgi:catechol 2,3-dioxygenase-like lactoylglutathione lyase family enzyme
MIEALYLVELTVRDWPASVDWYRNVLGLQLVMRVDADRFALFRAGPTRLALKAGEPRPGTTLLTFEVRNLAAQLERLAAHGVAPEGTVKASPEGYRRALLRDPDGYRLSLFEWDEAVQP